MNRTSFWVLFPAAVALSALLAGDPQEVQSAECDLQGAAITVDCEINATTLTNNVTVATGITADVQANGRFGANTVDGAAAGQGTLNFSASAATENTIGGIAGLAATTVDDAQIVTIDHNITATAFTLNGATAELDVNTAGRTLTGAIDGGAANQGILNIDVSATVVGSVGNANGISALEIADTAIFDVNGNTAATTTTLEGATAELNITGAATVTSAIDGNAAGVGILDIDATTTVAGSIGATNGIAALEIANAAVLGVNASIRSTATTLQGATAELNVTGAATLTSTIDGAAAGQGILDVDADTSTAGVVGGASALADIQVANGTSFSINNNVSSTAITLEGATGTLDVNTDNVTITGAVDGGAANQGILDVDATATIVGAIGGINPLASADIAASETLSIAASAAVNNQLVVNGTLDVNAATTITANDAGDTGQGLEVAAGGTLDTNNTVTLAGDGANFASGAKIAMSGTLAGTTFVNGATNNQTVTVPGNLTVSASGSVKSGNVITVIDATGGTYAGVTGTLTVQGGSLLTNFTVADDVGDNNLLTLTAKQKAAADLGIVGNGGAAIDAVTDVLAADAEVDAALNSLVQLSDLNDAAEQLAPDPTGSAVVGVVSANTAALSTASLRLVSLRTGGGGAASGFATGDQGPDWQVWTKAFANVADQDRRDEIDGYDAKTGGVAFGADNATDGYFRVGGMVGWAVTDVDGKGVGNNQTDIFSYQATLYGSYEPGQSFVEGFLSYAYNDIETQRTINFGGLNRTASGDTHGNQYSAKVAVGRDYGFGNLTVTPKMSVQYTRVVIDDFTETGAGVLNLTVDTDEADLLVSSLGASFSWEFDHQGATFSPEIRTAYLYDFIGDDFQSTNTFTGGGAAFDTNGADVAQHSGSVGFGLTYETDDARLLISADYDAEVKSDFLAHSAALTARFNF